jgi:hypothetical protein
MGVEMLLSMSQWPPFTWSYSQRIYFPNRLGIYILAEGKTYIVVITTRSYTIDDECPDLFDAGKRRYGAHDEDELGSCTIC